ncbi:hypothetical protein BDZ89DRAFT_1127531 [Hymenopellis radicata]|nr:hypothetical protein BDZ89DRAFT_1127531 [Hymenopellis radicata]
MKFTSINSLLYLLPAALLASAGVFNSPAAGSTISSTEPFNLTFTSGKYYKEQSESITVLLAPSPFTRTGTTLVKDLAPSTVGIYVYYSDLTPSYFYGGNTTGLFDIVILETYSAYSGIPATDVWTQTVTIA